MDHLQAQNQLAPKESPNSCRWVFTGAIPELKGGRFGERFVCEIFLNRSGLLFYFFFQIETNHLKKINLNPNIGLRLEAKARTSVHFPNAYTTHPPTSLLIPHEINGTLLSPSARRFSIELKGEEELLEKFPRYVDTFWNSASINITGERTTSSSS